MCTDRVNKCSEYCLEMLSLDLKNLKNNNRGNVINFLNYLLVKQYGTDFKITKVKI